ncbi:hypothetical protein HKX69_33475 [Streptomyces argyrophyllae]|uniref:TniQ domain-containing protein n=2 Tax=Streptomyces argyrophylli TaxID=2726118 RepID=A0A6M4PRT0_9ACTN|nr:hypothetical protein HKX69_33475 [Streptomyces argyrophyllae]
MPGLVLRLACRLERSPARIAELCGLSHRQNRLPAEYLLALPTSRAEEFARVTRLNIDEAHALTLSSLADSYPPLASVRLDGNRNATAARNSWAANLSSRYCPACLSGDESTVQRLYGGPWKLRWHLPVSFACTTHRCLLVHTCPRCRGLPNQPATTERQGLIMQRTVSGLHPAQCRHLAPPALGGQGPRASLCSARFDQGFRATAVTDSDLLTLLTLQHRIDQHLTLHLDASHSHPDPLDRYFFPDLIVAAHLIRLSWPDGTCFAPSGLLADLIDHHLVSAAVHRHRYAPGQRAGSTWAAPEDPAECAALLVAAHALLVGEDHGASGLVDRVQPLAAAAYGRSAANISATLRRMDVSPDLARALACRSDGFYRAGGRRQAKQQVPSRRCRFGIQHVPALLPETWLHEHFSDLLSLSEHPSDGKVRHLRRVASLKLAEMSAGGTWPECAKKLQIPWRTAQQSLRVVKNALTESNLWPAFDEAMESLARQLDASSDRVDYRSRRALLEPWRLSDTDWAQLCHGLSRFRRGINSPNEETATALIWAQVTQGDHLHSPVLSALRQSGQSTHRLVASISQLRTPANRKGAKLELLCRLEAYAVRLAAISDQQGTSAASTSSRLAGSEITG